MTDDESGQRRRISLPTPVLEEPAEPVRPTRWGYASTSSAGVARTGSERDMHAARVLAESGTPLVAARLLRAFTVAHLPWMALGLGLLVVGALVSAFTGLRWVWLLGLALGLVATFAPVALLVRRARPYADLLDADEPALAQFAALGSPALGLAVLRARADGTLSRPDADESMRLVGECEAIAARVRTRGDGEDAEEVDRLLAITSDAHDLSRLFIRLQEIEERVEHERRYR